MRKFWPFVFLVAGAPVYADMQAMDDSELSEVDGAGIGFVLDGIVFDASQATITINDITNGSGQNVPISVKEFYLAASGSNKGSTLNPANVGRLSYPFALTLAKGEDLRTYTEKWNLQSKQVTTGGQTRTVYFWAPTGVKQWVQTTPSERAVLELTFPTLMASGGNPCVAGFTGSSGAESNCSSRSSEKVDMGIRYDFQVTAGRTDVLNFDIGELVMDGSYLRLWGDSTPLMPITRQQLVGEMRMNIYAKTLDLTSCASGTTNCTTSAEQAARTIFLTNAYANVALGYGLSQASPKSLYGQPLLFDVTSSGQFALELSNPIMDPQNPDASVNTNSGVGKDRADDFYANAPRTNIVIDNLNAGYGRPPAGGFTVTMPAAAVYTSGDNIGKGIPGQGGMANGSYNFGRNEIRGLSFNYLRVSSYDL